MSAGSVADTSSSNVRSENAARICFIDLSQSRTQNPTPAARVQSPPYRLRRTSRLREQALLVRRENCSLPPRPPATIGANCRIVKCLEAKGLDFCYECDDYPECEKFHGIADHLVSRGEDLMENLEKIKAGKVDEWLEEEDTKWRCPKCGNPISAYLDECHWCQAKVKQR